MLNINSISKTFNNKKILDNFSLSITKQGIYGLKGESGVGKTTLLKMIQNLEAIDSGTIEVGVKTSFMFQDFQLFPHFTVLENVIYASKFCFRSSKEECLYKAKKILQDLDLLDKISEYPHRLSGGQKQRVAFARAIMIGAKLILCDEPTSGLDFESKENLKKILFSFLNGESRVSFFIVSHDLEFLFSVCSETFLLKKPD